MGSIKRVTTAGIAAFVLTGVFNAAAFASPPLEQEVKVPAPITQTQEVPPPAADVNTPPALSHAQLKQLTLNKALIDELMGWDNRFTELMTGDNANNIDLSKDTELSQAINNVKKHLADGANPNYVSDDGVSALNWAVWISYKLDRPDLLDAFLNNGADLTKTDSAGWNAVDNALMALRESQIDYLQGVASVSPVESAARVMKQLKDAGAGLDTASGMAQAIAGRDYLGLAFSPVTALVFRDVGLVDAKTYQEKMEISDALRSVAGSLTELDNDFLNKYNAPVLSYPDAPPGGPEPYEVGADEKLWDVAQKFQNAMGAENVLEAFKMIAERNGIALDAQNIAARELSAGEKIMIPVPVHHQIGNSPLSAADPIFGVAVRVMEETGSTDIIEVVQDIARVNSIMPGPFSNIAIVTAVGNELKFTKEDGSIGKVAVLPGDAFRGFAQRLTTTIDSHDYGVHKAGAPLQKAMEDLAEMNGFTLVDIESGKHTLKTGDSLWVNFYNDGFDHIEELNPPLTRDSNRRVDLIIIEDKDYHGKRTFGVTTNSGYALNHNLDLSQFHPWDENLFQYPGTTASDALRILMNLDGSPLQDRVVFSFSMAMAIDYLTADAARQARGPDDAGFENIRRNLALLETNKPVIFAGAGNWRTDIRGRPPGDEHYVQSWLAMHSPRAVNVGSSGIYPGLSGTDHITISPYSSHGADICAQLPSFLGNQQEGTSFSTPETATIYRQFSEWYGNVLTFEEIMAVGMMVTDLDILDYDTVDSIFETKPDGSRTAVAARYKTNGAGLQVHDRCGAGNISFENVQIWNEMLKKMVGFKMSMNDPGEFKSQLIEFGDAVEVRSLPNGSAEYIYHVKIPENLTLGKLTFLLPQEKGAHSEVFVKTPAGYEKHLPKSFFDIVSSTAFNYEDVKAGDVLEIRSAQPFGDHAGIYLRGHEDGNTIQKMRDYLHAQGILPAPLQNFDKGTLDVSSLKPSEGSPNDRNRPATARDVNEKDGGLLPNLPKPQ